MTNLMRSIDEWFSQNPPPDGWTTPETAKMIAACIMAVRPEVSVELGVFGGRSCIPVAMALKEIGRGTILCVDPWSAKASTDGMKNEDLAWWSRQDMHEAVYRRFLNEVNRLGLWDVIKVERKKSDEVDPPPNMGYLAIDANHGPQAERDFERFTPQLKVGGFLWADDLDWSGGHVQKSADKLTSQGFQMLYRMGQHGAMFQRIR